jgi:hypothetical protein
MSIEFISEEHWSHFTDPRNDFEPTKAKSEVRTHPLTGQITRVAHIGMPPRREYETPQFLADNAIPIFAPPMVLEVTPTFLPDELPHARYTRNDSTLFPNLNPYDRFSPVAAIGGRPFVEPNDLDPDDVVDALALMRQFFTDLAEDEHVGVVGWNFWPGAGSSIPHPHLQGVASGRVPERQARELAGERAYLEATGEPFWPAFLAAERNGPRWLGDETGWSAVVEFAPRSIVPEVVLVADSAGHLQAATDDALGGLARWLTRLAAAHTGLGVPEFNVVLHPTAPMDLETRLRARFIPRVYVVQQTNSSDVFWVQMGLEEAVTSIVPEEWAGSLRTALAAGAGA